MSLTLYHYLAIAAAVVAVVVGLLSGPWRRIAEASPDVIRRAAGRVRSRNLIALFASVGLLVTAVVTGFGVSSWDAYLQIVVAAPLAGASIALATVIVSPTPVLPNDPGPRQAELSPRDLTRFAPRSLVATAVALAIGSLGLLVAFVATSAPDGRGVRWESATASVVSTPYPGIFYAAPALGGLVVVAILTVVALRRVAGAPRPSGPGLGELDDALRETSSRLVLLTSVSGVGIVIAFLVVFAGSALRTLANGLPAAAALQLVGTIATLGGLALGLAVTVAAIVATATALRRPAGARIAGSQS